jgi:hypothetical protein
MNLNREPVDIAKAAAEEIRALNHRTLDAGVFEQPADIYRTVDALTSLTRGLPQAIEQTWKQLRAMEQDGAIRMANGKDVHEETERVRLALSEARRLLATGSGFLTEAGQILCNMGGQW